MLEVWAIIMVTRVFIPWEFGIMGRCDSDHKALGIEGCHDYFPLEQGMFQQLVLVPKRYNAANAWVGDGTQFVSFCGISQLCGL